MFVQILQPFKRFAVVRRATTLLRQGRSESMSMLVVITAILTAIITVNHITMLVAVIVLLFGT